MPSFEHNGRTIAYDDAGNGRTIVLLHGLLMDRTMWAHQLESLDHAYRVIAPDAPGHGDSDPAPAGWTFDDWAEEIWALLDELRVESAIVGGQSMGGWTAIRCAAARPQACRGLLLADTSAQPESPELRPQYEAFLEVALKDGVNEDLARLVLTILTSTRYAESEGGASWLAKLLAGDPARYEPVARAVFERPPIADLLPGLECPALVIHGTEDIAIPLDRAEELAAALGTTVHTIADAGHASPLERPEVVTPILRAFLDSVG